MRTLPTIPPLFVLILKKTFLLVARTSVPPILRATPSLSHGAARKHRPICPASAQKKPLKERLLVPPRGTVQPAKPSQKTRNFERQRAKASAAAEHQLEPDLQLVVDRWPELPAPIKAAILAMIQAS